MKEKIITEIINAMLPSLNNGQLKKLKDVLEVNLYNVAIVTRKDEENEQETSLVQRRGLYVVRKMEPGHIIKQSDLEPLRPRSDDGFEPWEKDCLIGRKVIRFINEGEMLLREDLE